MLPSGPMSPAFNAVVDNTSIPQEKCETIGMQCTKMTKMVISEW